jgi:hypothetical protein
MRSLSVLVRSAHGWQPTAALFGHSCIMRMSYSPVQLCRKCFFTVQGAPGETTFVVCDLIRDMLTTVLATPDIARGCRKDTWMTSKHGLLRTAWRRHPTYPLLTSPQPTTISP